MTTAATKMPNIIEPLEMLVIGSTRDSTFGCGGLHGEMWEALLEHSLSAGQPATWHGFLAMSDKMGSEGRLKQHLSNGDRSPADMPGGYSCKPTMLGSRPEVGIKVGFDSI